MNTTESDREGNHRVTSLSSNKRRIATIAATLVAAGGVVAGCGSDDIEDQARDQADQIRDDAEQAVDDASERAQEGFEEAQDEAEQLEQDAQDAIDEAQQDAQTEDQQDSGY